MKKCLKYLFFTVALFTTSYGGAISKDIPASYEKAFEIEILDFINVHDLTEDTLSDFIMGKMASIAIEFPENIQLPLELFLEGDLISLVKTEDSSPYIKFNKSIYLRNYNGNLYLSTNLKQWKPFEVFVTGKLQVGLSIKEVEGPVITLGAELHERISPTE
jgi:hypothetical protein